MLKYLQNRCLRPKYRVLYDFFIENLIFFLNFFFVPGIILDHSIHIFGFFLIKKIKKAPRSAGWAKRFFDFFSRSSTRWKNKSKNKIKKKIEKKNGDFY